MATVTETFVKSTDDATATSHTITAVTIAAGKLAVIRFGYQSDTVTISSVTDDAGNTWSVAGSVHSASGDNQTCAIAYLVVPAGGLSNNTITIALSATATLAADLAYFNSDTGWVAQASVLDKFAGNNNGLVTAWTSGNTATTTQADELLVGAAYAGGAINGGTSSSTLPWVEEQEHVLTHGYELVTEWQHVVATGAYAATGTWSAAEIAACTIATFKTAAASGSPSPSWVQIPNPHVGPAVLRYRLRQPFSNPTPEGAPDQTLPETPPARIATRYVGPVAQRQFFFRPTTRVGTPEGAPDPSLPAAPPAQVPHQLVGPQALRRLVRRSINPQLATSNAIVFNDAASGTITLSGSGTESQSHSISTSGTITLSGTSSESQSHSSSASGTITLSGTKTESASAADSGAGTITLSGSFTQSHSHTATAAGTIVLSGTSSENFQPPGGSTYTFVANPLLVIYLKR